ncbi:uncharacterized protein LOC119725695 isoform X1 [Patiria miniata]|uniref:PHD-type domain-containing protein n=1 Tax=Patiria miniata TaxID=46514 RepID=A0A913ZP47_PATMI|nr:uncharacterized protein LOC119719594 isoform X1 [Patiria miniata]XP_038053149.1 uncharacterized protein LOC119725695 isoform X1 [Patiria miniata]
MAARSTYYQALDGPAKVRYNKILQCIDDIDPYTISLRSWKEDPHSLPQISYPDIVNFLVYTPSPYTLEDLKCYKGLDAYNQFVSGWVRNVVSTVINGKHVVTAKVMHSQRLREAALKPWLIAEKCGKIIATHCNCIAGLGEACTHVSALMFYIDTKVRIRDSKTVTQEPAYWKIPSAVKDAQYLPVAQIDFTSAKTKKRKLDMLVNDGLMPPPRSKVRKIVPGPTDAELTTLFSQMNATGTKPALLSVVPEHCHQFKPSHTDNILPPILTDLYNPQYSTLSFPDLLNRCNEFQLTITQEKADNVEKATRAQSSSKKWFRFRSGRTTASKMKNVCRTNPDQPSQSLIQSVCYPESCRFSTAATKWGCSHEIEARQAYVERMGEVHHNFDVKDSGLVINTSCPHIGASPDGRISCDCCGEGVLEIKCPFCARDTQVNEYASLQNTCLVANDNEVSLDRKHAYMYQVQTQIHTCSVDYADFVLWTNTDVHIERVEPDANMWDEILEKSREFFYKAVLPELMGKFYTRIPSVHDKPPATHCYCGKSQPVDKMISCANEGCKITWFHQSCLQIKRLPKGKWICPECRKIPRKKEE